MMSSTNLHATSPATIQSIPGKIISRRERRTADVRQRLFDAALTLFAERGFLKTTVEDITEAADVGKGTFFNYFPSKEQLLDSFSDTRIEKIRRALATITEKRSTVKDAVKQMYFDLSQDPGRSQELTRSMLLTMLTNQAVWGQVCSRMHESQELPASAPVNAPRSYPKNSDSSNCSGNAAPAHARIARIDEEDFPNWKAARRGTRRCSGDGFGAVV
jgi:AcrR family transcriptional regulator